MSENKNIKVMKEMPVTYFLRNNSFLNFKLNMPETDEHLINYTLAKAQKKLFETFGEIPEGEKINIESMPESMKVKIDIEEIQQIVKNRNQNKGAKLKKYCETLGSVQVSFINYATGNFALAPLVALFDFDARKKCVTATILREVYLFLYDYKLDMRGEKILLEGQKKEEIIDETLTYEEQELLKRKLAAEAKKKEVEEFLEKIHYEAENIEDKKEGLAKGYSKVELIFYDELKSIYARNLLLDFKAAIEKKRIYNKKILEITKTMTIDEIREKFMLEKKYKKYADLKTYVIDNAVNKINNSGYMEVVYEEETVSVRGGKKVIAIIFKAKMTEKLLNLDKIFSDKHQKLQESVQESKKKTIGEILSDKIRSEGKLKVGIKTLNDFISVYGEQIVKRAVIALLTANEKERIKAPKRWLVKTLEDMQTRENGYVMQEKFSNGINAMKFNNFEPRNYDYDKLEKKLLGWDDSDKNNEEYYSDLYKDVTKREEI